MGSCSLACAHAGAEVRDCRDWTAEDSEDAEDGNSNSNSNSNGSVVLQHRTDRAEGIRPSQGPARLQRWGGHPSFTRRRPRWDDSVRSLGGVGRTSLSPATPQQVTIRPYDSPDEQRSDRRRRIAAWRAMRHHADGHPAVSRVSFICSSLLQSSASSASSAVKKLFERVRVRKLGRRWRLFGRESTELTGPFNEMSWQVHEVTQQSSGMNGEPAWNGWQS
jgi:hypothetical protein